MPSKSKSQYRLFTWVKCVKTGKCKNAPDNIKKMANDMSMEQLDDFLNTYMNNLPDEVQKENIYILKYNDFLNEKEELPIVTWNPLSDEIGEWKNATGENYNNKTKALSQLSYIKKIYKIKNINAEFRIAYIKGIGNGKIDQYQLQYKEL